MRRIDGIHRCPHDQGHVQYSENDLDRARAIDSFPTGVLFCDYCGDFLRPSQVTIGGIMNIQIANMRELTIDSDRNVFRIKA